ncbi:PIG-L family deacetylase [Paracoccus pacificus]|uniref:PIG-L family deacetylase n=1 Tax=Paracoccus pacificus TaxID=1463598 RepID=A0ABW4R5J4_9RHOB
MTDHATTQMLIRDEAQPAILRLWRALGRLRSTVTFMNTGAHPDDEHSGLLAYLRFGRGMRIAIACSTRGEGGQNALGPERGDALGLIRTAEMEGAAEVLDAHIAWVGFGTDDPVHDFGFSKDGEDTLRRWRGDPGQADTGPADTGQSDTAQADFGHNAPGPGDLVTRRLAGMYRAMRPDIVLPTFLDVPGQHGHHRAMTRAAHAALALAADPGADLGDVHGGDLAPWRVAKFYLPGWSGGGGTYDDEVPPPATTVTVQADVRAPVLGVPYDRIGEWSRRRHGSQGMGDWPDPPQLSWPLHRPDGGAEGDITDDLPADLHQLAEMTGLPELAEAAQAIDAAIAAFPDPEAIIAPLLHAAASLRAAEAGLPAAVAEAHGHRIANKRREIDLALAEAAGIRLHLAVTPPDPAAGQQAALTVAAEHGEEMRILSTRFHAPDGVTIADDLLSVAKDAIPSPNFTALWSPFGDSATLWAEVEAELRGHRLTLPVAALPDLRILPNQTADISPAAVLLTPARRSARLMLQPADARLPPVDGLLVETLPDGGLSLSWPPGAAPMRQALALRNPDDSAADTIRRVALPDGSHAPLRAPARLEVLAVDTAAPAGRIGVIAGTDRSAEWLERLGADFDLIERPDPGVLAEYDSVLLGVMAMARGDVAPGTLRSYVEGGGNLLSFYQRPDRGWNADRSGPAFLRVGTPSLRWRVTDPEAAVTVLLPDHPLLTGPNRIGPEDWRGWVKDRGLYFAAEWDPAYQPLLSMSDRGEAPLLGALISARIGQGRHSYCALSLPQQMDALVPGAFRLFVNLLAPMAAG